MCTFYNISWSLACFLIINIEKKKIKWQIVTAPICAWISRCPGYQLILPFSNMERLLQWPPSKYDDNPSERIMRSHQLNFILLQTNDFDVWRFVIINFPVFVCLFVFSLYNFPHRTECKSLLNYSIRFAIINGLRIHQLFCS